MPKVLAVTPFICAYFRWRSLVTADQHSPLVSKIRFSLEREDIPTLKVADMTNQPDYDRVVGLLYDAVFTPERLPEALVLMTRLLDGDTCHLVGWGRDSGIPTLSISSGLPSEVGPDYAAHYAQIDPRRQLALTQRPGEILACHEHFNASFVSQNEFFQDYLIPQVGIHYLLGTNDLVENSDQMIILGFQRYVGHGPFEKTDSQLLACLLPHLRRSLKLFFQHREFQEARAFSQAAVDTSSLAMLGLSASGRVCWANQRGESLLRAGHCLTLARGALRATDVDGNVTLQNMLRTTAMARLTSNLSLSNQSGPEICYLTVMPMPERLTVGMPEMGAGILVLIATNTKQRVVTVHQLKELFGLSPAEARLVRAIAHGESLEEYAQHEHLKRSTLKTQLKSAMDKTGTETQRDLIRLVLPLPPVR